MLRQNRRNFLKQAAIAAVAAHGLPLFSAEKPAPGRCRPLTSGSLWWISPEEFRAMGPLGWSAELDRQQALGFDLLWLLQAFTVLETSGFNLLNLLDLCAERKVQVILDTGSTGQWYGPLDLKRELEVCRANISRIAKRLEGHPAFHAWYIPQEIYMCWGAMDRFIQELYPALAQACKSAANLPVTLSPFFILDRTKVFGDFQYNEPDEYQVYWEKLLRKSGIDVVMLQDSGEHFSYVTNDQRRPFFEAMSKACRSAGARFWGNVEVAEMECPSIEEYVRRYGRVHHSTVKDIPWRPVPMNRLDEKLKLAAEYAERIVSWGYQEYCRPGIGPAAKKWYDDYQAYYKSISSQEAPVK
jgi:hypothetical protein